MKKINIWNINVILLICNKPPCNPIPCPTIDKLVLACKILYPKSITATLLKIIDMSRLLVIALESNNKTIEIMIMVI